jgi:hypothetical protein
MPSQSRCTYDRCLHVLIAYYIVADSRASSMSQRPVNTSAYAFSSLIVGTTLIGEALFVGYTMSVCNRRKLFADPLINLL